MRLRAAIAVAFSCDTCRIATMKVGEIFSDFAGNWHENVAHQARLPDAVAQDIIASAHQRFFADVFVDLAAKLDAVVDSEGVTVLDTTLLHRGRTSRAAPMAATASCCWPPRPGTAATSSTTISSTSWVRSRPFCSRSPGVGRPR